MLMQAWPSLFENQAVKKMIITKKSNQTTDAPEISFGLAARSGLWAGFISGFVVLVPVLILQLSRGIGVVPEMQLAASSIIGIEAYEGITGFILGTLLHFFVSIVPAVAYALAGFWLPSLHRRKWLTGPLLGLLVFLFMGFVVLPRTNFITPPGVTPMPPFPALVIHMFGLGLPISLVVARIQSRRLAG